MINQLKEEHRTLYNLLNRIKEAIIESSRIGARHAEKEEPLYQAVLEEVLKKVGK